MKQRVFKGEITVFLSLLFVLMLSLVGALLQSASIHIARSRKRADMQMALESVFAEYHKELFDEYGIFAREVEQDAGIARRLEFYGVEQTEHRIQSRRLLSDGMGQAFYEQALLAMREKEFDASIGGSDNGFLNNGTPSFEQEESQAGMNLDEILSQEGQEMPQEDNPIVSVKELKKGSLLSLVCPKEQELSDKGVELSSLASHRRLQKGSAKYQVSNKSGAEEKLVFLAYLAEHFTDYSKQKETKGLSYESEYLLSGLSSDKENLEAAVKKLLTIRMVANYTYLQTDAARKAEAEAMALTLSSLLTIPGATEIVKQVLLFSWAYGESVVDLRVLLKGKRVPAVKSDETWQLQLANLAKLGTQEESVTEGDGSKGLSYADYLKLLLALEDSNSLCMRALDLMECRLGIRTDTCVTAMEIRSVYALPRGLEDSFVSSYAYH
ncbi:MAG: DUF5702 domain-containing protein [Faecalimonas sp.]|nr:DUF5702 domain-containing protein [Faecalimonas sp.]